MSAPENHVLREFLLHRVGEADAHALEERLMTEDGFLEALQDAEHDLLDDYASDQLSGQDRADVERYLLATPEARQRLEVGRALARARAAGSVARQHDEGREPHLLDTINASAAVSTPARTSPDATAPAPRAAPRQKTWPPSRTRPPRRRSWQLALAAAACVAIIAFLVPFRFRPVDPNSRMELLLLAENSRSATAQPVDIDTGASEVALQLEVPQVSQTAVYGVEILDAQSQRTHEAHGLRAQDVSGYSIVQLTVPGSAFQSGRHTIILSESQPGDPAAPATEAFRWQININRR
jgi:hypothetical protein